MWTDKRTGLPPLDPSTKTAKASGRGSVRTLPDPSIYEMRQMTVTQVRASMHAIVSTIRSMSRTAAVIFIVSPIPLALSASDQPVFVADCLSKSALRVAIDELRREELPSDVYYFPSFEILRWFATMVDPIWGADGLWGHVRHDWIEYTISKFRQFYCEGETPISPPIP